eukprot:jgi/Hompol1/1748/HPOL_000004-RA
MSICQELAKSGWISKVLGYIKWVLFCLEDHAPFANMEHFAWRMECYKAYFKYSIELNELDEAEAMIERAIDKLMAIRHEHERNRTHSNMQVHMHRNQKTGSRSQSSEPPTNEILASIDTYLHQLNILQFACEAKHLSHGRTPEQLVQQKIQLSLPAHPGTAFQPIIKSKVRQTRSEFVDDRPQTRPVTSTTVVSNISVGEVMFGQNTAPERFDFISDARKKGYLTNTDGKKVLKHRSLFSYSSYMFVGRDDCSVRTKKVVACMRSLAQIESSKTHRLGDSPGSSIHDLSKGLGIPQNSHLQDTKSEPVQPIVSDDANTQTQQQQDQKNPSSKPAPITHSQPSTEKPEQATDPKQKRVAQKKTRVFEETEEAKLKRLILTDVLFLVQTLPEDRDRLTAIVLALRVITTMENVLRVAERTTEEPTFKDHVINRLIDVAFFIIISTPDSLGQENVSAQIAEFKGGKKFVYPDMARITMTERAGAFFIDDMMLLIRFLFENRQWERLQCILQMVYPLIKDNHRVQHQYGLEITLRAAASRFLLTLQADRRVLFESKHLQDRATPSDLHTSRFDLADSVHIAISDLFIAISNCVDVPQFVKREGRLIYDVSSILWYFSEPFVRELKSVKDACLYSSLGRNDTLILVLEFIHQLQILFPNTEPITTTAISAKLGLLLECIACYSDAVKVLSTALKCTDIARVHLGEGSNLISSTTFDTSFHPGLSRQIEEEESRANSLGITEDSKIVLLRKQLGSTQIGLLSSLYRCQVKNTVVTESKNLKNKEMECLRLAQKRVHLYGSTIIPTEETLLKNCGHDHVRRAVYIMTVVSMGDQMTVPEKSKLLNDAAEYLRAAHQVEAELLNVLAFDLSHLATNWMPRLVRRTPHSITISPGPIKSSDRQPKQWFQAFATQSGHYLSKSSLELYGTGDVHPLIGKKPVEITISNLKPCMAYDLAITMYQQDGKGVSESSTSQKIRIITCLPMPVLLCWGFLSEVAHQTGCHVLADMSFSVLSSHFVCSKASDDVLRRLATDEYTGIDHNPVYELFEVAVRQSSPAIILAFIQSIFSSIDRLNAEVYQALSSSVQSMGDMLSSQLCRLRASRDLLMAAELAKQIGDGPLQLLCALKAYQSVLPFLLFDIPCAFVVHVLMTCHEIIVMNASHFDDDKAKGLRDFFVPITYHLIRRLIERESFMLAAQIAQDSIQLINSSINSNDLRISNSTAIEQSWLGFVLKPKRLRGNQTKAHYYAEFIFQAKVAVSNDPKRGVSHLRKQFDVLYEFLEVVIAQNSHDLLYFIGKALTPRPV